eukprot:jgi/Ulvmu1/7826/UM004_0055.1
MRALCSTAMFRACVHGRQAALNGYRYQHDEAIRKAFSNCQDTVREHDYENYLWAKLLGPSQRAPIMMLRALNAEISTIGDVVAQGGDAVRKVRFQWWRDAIDSAYTGRPVNHPVVTALSYCLTVQNLSKYRLQRLVAAREADQVNHVPFSNIQAMEDFAESTQSQLLYLQLEAASIKDAEADHAASHLGKAVGIASLLRGMRHFLSRKINYLPVDLCAKHGVVIEQLLQGHEWESKGMQEVVYEMASTAHLQLKQSVDLHGESAKVPKEARRLFLSGTSCRLFLQALERHQFQLFSPGMARGGYTPLWYAMQLHWDQTRI